MEYWRLISICKYNSFYFICSNTIPHAITLPWEEYNLTYWGEKVQLTSLPDVTGLRQQCLTGCARTGKLRPFLWGLLFLPSHKMGTQLLFFVWMNEQMNEWINEMIQREHNRTLWYIIKIVTDFPHPCTEPLCNVTLLPLLSKMESVSLPVEFMLGCVTFPTPKKLSIGKHQPSRDRKNIHVVMLAAFCCPQNPCHEHPVKQPGWEITHSPEAPSLQQTVNPPPEADSTS